MIIDTKLNIAFKCDKCSHIQFFDISIFKILRKENSVLKCECEESYIRIIKMTPNKFKLAIYCPKCDDTHIFLLSRSALINERLFIMYCPYSKMELCILGNDKEAILKEVDKIEKKIENYINLKCEYKDYFTNPRVMLESLDKINAILKNGKLICRCGNADIAVFIFKDKLLLRCKECKATKELKAASNNDLMELLNKRGIFLGQ